MPSLTIECVSLLQVTITSVGTAMCTASMIRARTGVCLCVSISVCGADVVAMQICVYACACLYTAHYRLRLAGNSRMNTMSMLDARECLPFTEYICVRLLLEGRRYKAMHERVRLCFFEIGICVSAWCLAMCNTIIIVPARRVA